MSPVPRVAELKVFVAAGLDRNKAGWLLLAADGSRGAREYLAGAWTKEVAASLLKLVLVVWRGWGLSALNEVNPHGPHGPHRQTSHQQDSYHQKIDIRKCFKHDLLAR